MATKPATTKAANTSIGKITQEVRASMDEKAEEFRSGGGELYVIPTTRDKPAPALPSQPPPGSGFPHP